MSYSSSSSSFPINSRFLCPGKHHLQHLQHPQPPSSSPKTTTNNTLSLTESCTKKCIPVDYREGDLNKGESVCLDRCVSKFFDVNVKVSEKMQGEAAANRQGGGMGMGM